MALPSDSHPLAPPPRPPYHQSQTVEDVVQQNINTIIQLDNAARAQRTVTDRVVDTITAFCGSLAFVWVHALWFGGWIGENLIRGSKDYGTKPLQLLEK